MDRLTEKGFNFTSDFIASHLQSWPIAQAMKRLQEYEDAEEQGRLVRLPCKVGDTIFRVDIDPKLPDSDVESYIVDSFTICEDGEVLIRYDAYDAIICTVNNLINKTPYLDYYLCFLTREEAEAALAGKEHTCKE